jgi:biotin carboxylase
LAGPPASSVDGSEERPRVVLLANPLSYRFAAFEAAARRLGYEVVRGLDLPAALSERWGVTLPLDFTRPEEAVARLVAFHAERPVAAILALDDTAALLAARANAALGLRHNDLGAAEAARDKRRMREAFAAGDVPVPAFRPVRLDADPASLDVPFPCVVKPTMLNGSRGVIRADTSEELVAAFARTRDLLLREGIAPEAEAILIEAYLPGIEVALEGLLTDGRLQVLALFDKPDPLEGPYFEETIYITPSRLPSETQRAIGEMTERAAAAVGVRHGPIHAELRLNERGVWPIELAGRSIGGLCSTILEFGTGMGLEELILRHAVEGRLPPLGPPAGASGVMMIPIPKRGILRAVEGQEAALAVPGVTGIEITAGLNAPIVPLPEGASYLGFIFARGETPDAAEAVLRTAHAHLTIRIDPMLSLMVG